jgi:hypothetical protein
MLNASFRNNLGLLSGKMGICIFFYRYARLTDKKLYTAFAGELVDEIYAEINTKSPLDFKDGLAGICWGMEYLIRNGFVDADADEILENIDISIMERDVRRMRDTSLETGLEGLAHYVLARCSNKPKLPLGSRYIAELGSNMESMQCNPKLVAKLGGLLRREEVYYKFDLIDLIAGRSKYKPTPLSRETNIGISKNGLTGTALRIMNEQAR